MTQLRKAVHTGCLRNKVQVLALFRLQVGA